LPEKSGVYLFKTEKGEILYIGKALNLRQRVRSHFQEGRDLFFLEKIARIDYILVDSEFEALLLEASLIKKYTPRYNIRLKDDKSPLYIKITDEEFPRVYPARKTEGGFGPYPSAKTVRLVLKYLRRIFPYRSCKKLPRKPCLYFDLNLCKAVCVNQSPEDKKEYQKTIFRLKNLLSQKSQKVINDLNKEMRKKAEKEDFLGAKEIKEKILQIEYLFKKRHLPEEYLKDPNLILNLRKEELWELEKILGLKKEIVRIEGFDISNLAGKMATGGMVVFINGEPDKSFYRRFKIKITQKKDDISMMREVIFRRLKHPEWNLPDLILVDGGKGQIKACMDSLKNLGLEIPVIGLAKRWETVMIPRGEKGIIKFKEIKLPINSPALNLLKRIRDESHRFARNYHLKLRKIV